MFNESIFDKDTAELFTQFSRLKQTKISRQGSDLIDLEGSFWSRLKKLAERVLSGQENDQV